MDVYQMITDRVVESLNRGTMKPRYELYRDRYVGSPIKVIDTLTDYVVCQFDPWKWPYDSHTARYSAEQACKRLNEALVKGPY